MDNTVVPYTLETDSSEESDDSDSSEEGNLLTNNLGVFNDKFETKDVRFMNQEKAEDYQLNRNKLFTPEIIKKFITVFKNDTELTKVISLNEDFKIPTKNIIGFKIVRSSFATDSTTLSHFDLSIPEIPEIACDITDTGKHIISRIPLTQTSTGIFAHCQFLEYLPINRYFYPTTLDKLTLTLTEDLKGYFVFEITYLNEKVHKG